MQTFPITVSPVCLIPWSTWESLRSRLPVVKVSPLEVFLRSLVSLVDTRNKHSSRSARRESVLPGPHTGACERPWMHYQYLTVIQPGIPSPSPGFPSVLKHIHLPLTPNVLHQPYRGTSQPGLKRPSIRKISILGAGVPPFQLRCLFATKGITSLVRSLTCPSFNP